MGTKIAFDTGNGRLVITENGHDCYRDYYGHLGLYGDEQYKLYGSKETLAALIKRRYHITPGKYIRQLGDTVLFFPTKTGLTGTGTAVSTWRTEYWYTGPLDGLVSFAVGDISAAALERFRNSFGCWDNNRGIPENPLLLYQYGRLYCVEHEKPVGRFWLKDITDAPWLGSTIQQEFVSLLKMRLHDLLYWQGMLPEGTRPCLPDALK